MLNSGRFVLFQESQSKAQTSPNSNNIFMAAREEAHNFVCFKLFSPSILAQLKTGLCFPYYIMQLFPASPKERGKLMVQVTGPIWEKPNYAFETAVVAHHLQQLTKMPRNTRVSIAPSKREPSSALCSHSLNRISYPKCPTVPLGIGAFSNSSAMTLLFWEHHHSPRCKNWFNIIIDSNTEYSSVCVWICFTC